jgi:hypothetical protein
MTNELLALMNEKLHVLQRALILETDAAVKFNLRIQVDELKEQIAACQTNIPRPQQPVPLTHTSPMTSENRPMKTIKLFYCYSHEDEVLRDRLEVNLAGLKRRGIINEWHDRKIGLGEDWRNALDENLKSAEIILLLISPDFIASDYCYDRELMFAMQRHETGEAVVIPIILDFCHADGLPFMKLQGAPRDRIPVTAKSWTNQNEAFTDIAKKIEMVAEDVRKRIPK